MVQEHEHEHDGHDEEHDHAEDVGQEEVAEKFEVEQEQGYRGHVPDDRDYTMRNAGVPPEDEHDGDHDEEEHDSA